jgi:hypothetical protein
MVRRRLRREAVVVLLGRFGERQARSGHRRRLRLRARMDAPVVAVLPARGGVSTGPRGLRGVRARHRDAARGDLAASDGRRARRSLRTSREPREHSRRARVRPARRLLPDALGGRPRRPGREGRRPLRGRPNADVLRALSSAEEREGEAAGVVGPGQSFTRSPEHSTWSHGRIGSSAWSW